MNWKRSGVWSVLLTVAPLLCAAGCKSNNVAPGGAFGGGAGAGGAAGGGGAAGTAGAGGTAGAADAGGDACAPTAGAGGAVDPKTGCAMAYVLPHYDGDTCGLCDPGVSTQCSHATGCDWGAAVTVECSPDGTVCALFGALCSGPTECGWGTTAVCPALYAAAKAETATTISRVCAKDGDCAPGHYCGVRIANRMFCDNGALFYAKDYCPDAGKDAGADAPDAGADASDAGTDASDAGAF